MATRRQLEDFKDHIGWKEMLQTVLDRISIIRDELEVGQTNQGEKLSLEDIAERRGECRSLRFIAALPDALIREINEGKEKEDG